MKQHARQQQRVRRAGRATGDVLTVEDVAVKLGIGRNQAYEAVHAGKIPSLRVGRRWLIPRPAFDRILNGEILKKATS
jgi:excisionase family DNA binding protein